MAGRNHLNRAPNTAIPNSRHVHRVVIPSASTSVRTQSSTALEDRIDIQHREIQSLLVDNQRLAANHVALKQELAAKQQELRALSAAAAEAKAERDAEVREVYERSLKLDAEVRNIDAMSNELSQVRTDVKELGAIRQELEAKLRDIEDELVSARSETKHMPSILADIEALNLEIQKGRAAIEMEKKTHASNIANRKTMDKNMDIMAREIERLRTELANAEKRARARAAAAVANHNTGYTAPHCNPDMGYGGEPYNYPYSLHQAQGGGEPSARYGSAPMPQTSLDMEITDKHS